MKISFEEAIGVGDREEPDRSSVSPEVIDGIPSDPNGPYDFGQQFDRGHVPSPLAVGVEDVRQAVEETNPVRGLLRVPVEDREAILRRNESLEAPQIRLGSAHNPGTSEAVLGITAGQLPKERPAVPRPGARSLVRWSVWLITRWSSVQKGPRYPPDRKIRPGPSTTDV